MLNKWCGVVTIICCVLSAAECISWSVLGNANHDGLHSASFIDTFYCHSLSTSAQLPIRYHITLEITIRIVNSGQGIQRAREWESASEWGIKKQVKRARDKPQHKQQPCNIMTHCNACSYAATRPISTKYNLQFFFRPLRFFCAVFVSLSHLVGVSMRRISFAHSWRWVVFLLLLALCLLVFVNLAHES